MPDYICIRDPYQRLYIVQVDFPTLEFPSDFDPEFPSDFYPEFPSDFTVYYLFFQSVFLCKASSSALIRIFWCLWVSFSILLIT